MNNTIPSKIKIENEAGFSLVELIIAAVIVVVVLVGAYTLFSGAGKTQAQTALRSKAANATERIGERLQADAKWITDDCKSASGCDFNADAKFEYLGAYLRSFDGCSQINDQMKNIPGCSINVESSHIEAKGVDSKVDGTGASDADNDVTDFIRVTITIVLTDEYAKKMGISGDGKIFTTSYTVDPSTIGRSTGTVKVSACQVVNQHDERMNMSGCVGSNPSKVMARQPEPCKPLTGVWQLECNNSFKSAKAYNPYYASMAAKPISNIKFTISYPAKDPITGEEIIKTRNSDFNDGFDEASATWIFRGIPAGVAKIAVDKSSVPSHIEQWMSHSVPTGNEISVQGKKQSDALLAFRPKTGVGEYKVNFTRTVKIYTIHSKTIEEGPEIISSSSSKQCKTLDWGWFQFTYCPLTVSSIGTRYIRKHVAYVTGPELKTYGGPAWNGWVAMEPKPFSRHAEIKSGKYMVPQYAEEVVWKEGDNPTSVTIKGLPTGTHSLPVQVSPFGYEAGDLDGNLGKRIVSHKCLPGGSDAKYCNKFAYISPQPDSLGEANGQTTFHSNDGECIIVNTTPAPISSGVVGPGKSTKCKFNLLPGKVGKSFSTPGYNMLYQLDARTCVRVILKGPKVFKEAEKCNPSMGGWTTIWKPKAPTTDSVPGTTPTVSATADHSVGTGTGSAGGGGFSASAN